MKDPVSGEVVPTRLAALLRAAGAEQLVVVGLATDYCVRATALEGREQGWAVTVPWSGVAAVDLRPGDGERTRVELQDAGVTVE
jgi:nicotinamidase/pyrazinamidase